jgi:Phage integrase, N-terminal SAM-like domain
VRLAEVYAQGELAELAAVTGAWSKLGGVRATSGQREESAAAATIRSMSAEHQAALIPAESPAVVLPPVVAGHPGERAAVELVARVRTELPAMAGLPAREELLAAAWLMSLRSARTRRAYAGDLRAWLAWLAVRDVDVLEADRVHVDMWVRGQQDQGAEPASVRRRLSALSSFYPYCARARSDRPDPDGRDRAAGRGPGLHRDRGAGPRAGPRPGRRSRR